MYTGWSLLGLSVGPDFFEHRRIARKALGPTAAPQYDPLIQEQIASFLLKLSTTSGDPFNVITPLVHYFDTLNSRSYLRSSVGEIIAKIAYGRDFYEKHGAALIKTSLEAMAILIEMTTKFWAVDLFPFCAFWFLPWRKSVSYDQSLKCDISPLGFLGPNSVASVLALRIWSNRSDLDRSISSRTAWWVQLLSSGLYLSWL
jgi:hypothetical protein